MKKGLLALLCLSLVVALPACKKDKTTKDTGKKEMKKKDGAKKEKSHKGKKDKNMKKDTKTAKEAMPRRAGAY